MVCKERRLFLQGENTESQNKKGRIEHEKDIEPVPHSGYAALHMFWRIGREYGSTAQLLPLSGGTGKPAGEPQSAGFV